MKITNVVSLILLLSCSCSDEDTPNPSAVADEFQLVFNQSSHSK